LGVSGHGPSLGPRACRTWKPKEIDAAGHAWTTRRYCAGFFETKRVDDGQRIGRCKGKESPESVLQSTCFFGFAGFEREPVDFSNDFSSQARSWFSTSVRFVSFNISCLAPG